MSRHEKKSPPVTRQAFASRNGDRGTYSATFVRFGTKDGWVGPVPTVLLKDVKDLTGLVVTDHLWFNLTKGFDACNLQPGDVVAFDARVAIYRKGYQGYRDKLRFEKPITYDYKLSHPTKVGVVRRVDLQASVNTDMQDHGRTRQIPVDHSNEQVDTLDAVIVEEPKRGEK